MKKTILMAVFMGLTSGVAQADQATLVCESSIHNIRLSLENTSDVQVETVGLEVNGRARRVTRVVPNQTRYGILSMAVVVGSGRGSTRYLFENLGSSECFGVSGSGHRGAATVDVINSMGRIGHVECECLVD